MIKNLFLFRVVLNIQVFTVFATLSTAYSSVRTQPQNIPLHLVYLQLQKNSVEIPRLTIRFPRL